MSISGISSDPTVSQNYASNPFQQVRKDFAALGKALQSGNVSDAQNAFATLQTDMQNIGQSQNSQQAVASTQQAGANSQLDNDLNALSSALGNGDLQGAQKAFAAVQKDMQQARQTQGGQQTQKAHHHHHHHGGGAQNAQNTTSNPLSDLAAVGAALNSTSGTDTANLAAAKNAFATLQQDMGTSTTATPGTDFGALSSALQSGNLSDAQTAFNTLMQDLQNSIGTLGSGASQAIGTGIDVAT
jgi:hypothetical protein